MLPIPFAALLGLSGARSTHAVIRNVFPPQGVTQAIDESSPGDSILVHPGIYVFEVGTTVTHPITIIGVGGASENEIRICTDLCPGALLTAQVGPVVIEGLTLTRNQWFPGGTHGIIAQALQNLTVKNCVFYDLNGLAVMSIASNVRIQGNLFLFHGLRIGSGTGQIIGNTFIYGSILTGDVAPATPTFSNNIFYGTSVECDDGDPIYACNNAWKSSFLGCPNFIGVNNNFTADPLFCDPNVGDYDLRRESPCLPEHSPGLCGLIGANGPCEFIGIEDPPAVPSISRFEVSPNPSSGKIVFSLAGVNSTWAVEIFDAQGRQVDVLGPMVGQLTWNPDPSLTRGIYFARATAGTPSVVKCVLLK